MTRRCTPPAVVGLLLLAASCGSTNTTGPAAAESPSTPPSTTSVDAATEPTAESPSTPLPITTNDGDPDPADSPMSVEPVEALPGAEVELVYDPPDTERVPTFTLEVAADNGWRATHLLAAGYDDVEPANAPIDDQLFGGEMFTRRDLTNDRILLPLDIPPGPARICTKDLFRGFCAEFEIIGDP